MEVELNIDTSWLWMVRGWRGEAEEERIERTARSAKRYTASAKSGRISLTAPTAKHPFESAQPYIKELSPTGGGNEAVFSNSTRRWTKRTKDAKFIWNMALATRP